MNNDIAPGASCSDENQPKCEAKIEKPCSFEQRVAVLFLILGGYLLGAQLVGWAVGFMTYKTSIGFNHIEGASRGARIMMLFGSRTEIHMLIAGLLVVLLAVYLGEGTWVENLRIPFLGFSIIIFALLLSSTIIIAVHVDFFPSATGFDLVSFRRLMFLILDLVFLLTIIIIQLPSWRKKLARIYKGIFKRV